MKKLALALVYLLALWSVPANATSCTAGCAQWADGQAFSGNVVGLTLTGVVAGHTIRFFVCTQNSSTITATVGGSAAVIGAVQAANGTTQACSSGYFANSPSGSVAVNATTSNACASCTIWVEEWAGDATVTPGDGQNAAYVTTSGTIGDAIACGNITTTGSNDSIWTAYFQANGTESTIPSGYTKSVDDYAVTGYISAFKTSVTPSTTNPTWSAGNGFDNYVACQAFKAAGGATAAPTRMLMGVGK